MSLGGQWLRGLLLALSGWLLAPAVAYPAAPAPTVRVAVVGGLVLCGVWPALRVAAEQATGLLRGIILGGGNHDPEVEVTVMQLDEEAAFEGRSRGARNAMFAQLNHYWPDFRAGPGASAGYPS